MTKNKNTIALPLLEHLGVLRRKLLWVFIFFCVTLAGTFYVADDLFNILVRPLAQIWEGQDGRRLIYTALHEKFLTNVRLGFFAAAFLTFPVLMIQVGLFVAPGLHHWEKRYVWPFFLLTPLLFFFGAALVYFVILPVAWTFFAGFEQAGDAALLAVVMEPKVSEYLSLVMRLMFAFGLVFELPVVLVFLMRTGLVSPATLRRQRRLVFVLAFIVAAFLTPPDPISQITLALPIILLYELSLLLVASKR